MTSQFSTNQKHQFNLIKVMCKLPSWSIRYTFYLLAKCFFNIKVTGQGNLPTRGGALLVANHVTFIDSFFIIASVPRMVRFVMIKKVYDNPLLHWFFKLMNMIPIDTKNSKEALEDFNQRCQDEINAGNIVCIFAEGQLSRNGHLQGFKKGIEHIAKGINAPIIPLHMEGLHKVPLAVNPVLGKMNSFAVKHLFKKVFIAIGKPLSNKTTSFVVRKRIKTLEMNNLSHRFHFLNKIDREAYVIERNYHTLKSLFPVNGDYEFISDLQENSMVHKMIKRKFSSIKNTELVLCTTMKSLEERVQSNRLPGNLSFLFVVDGTIHNRLRTQLEDRFNDLSIYEGWADFEQFPIIALNTNDWEGKGVDGKKVLQEGQKKHSVGRVLHGVAIRIEDIEGEVDQANTEGNIFLKYLPDSEWVMTGKRGWLDERGFLFLAK